MRSQQFSEIVIRLDMLTVVAKHCAFEAVTAEKYREEYIQDPLATGLRSLNIRSRLLEHVELTL